VGEDADPAVPRMTVEVDGNIGPDPVQEPGYFEIVFRLDVVELIDRSDDTPADLTVIGCPQRDRMHLEA
jgi:hypothetical protein